MAWRTPMVNTTRPQMAATNPIVAQAENAGFVSAPVFTAYDPKDRTDPLYLHPNESPSLQLVTTPLLGRSNYHPWARAMEMALKSKNKMVLVDGSLAIPGVTDPKYFYWDQCNTMVLSWILSAVSPTIGQGVLWINTAEGVWKDLKKRFSQQDEFRIADIRSKIYRMKQAFAMIHSCQRSKLSLRARKCVFFGFANGVKGYKLYDLQTKEIFLSRDVSFYENSFPFQDNHDELNDEASLKTDIVLPSGGVIYSDNEEQVQDTIISPESHQQNQEDTDIQTQSVPSVQEGEPIAESAIEPQARRSTRIRTIPTYLSDYACQNTTVRRTSPHIISNVLSYNSLSQKYRAFAVNALGRAVVRELEANCATIPDHCCDSALRPQGLIRPIDHAGSMRQSPKESSPRLSLSQARSNARPRGQVVLPGGDRVGLGPTLWFNTDRRTSNMTME
nr:uncharacterized protein LOC109166032 [Ipomoea batatas]GMD47494.1 uncharacterized protein LOC109166032 [Ipomoea batatas]